MLILSKTYQIVDEESAEHGEAKECGFEWQDAPHTFREVVELLTNEFTNPSCSHGVPRWVMGEDDTDYVTGECTTYSLHPAKDARTQRYWAKACKAAGICK